MDIKPYDKTVRELFVSGRQFSIPRFQREYSWDKKNYQEFYQDMMSNLIIENGHISSSQYFLGTMLFIGNFAEGTEQEIQVVDGQQRLTTITIFFSALSDRFRLAGENTLSEQIFKYIMTKDDNGNDVRIIKSKTHYPFFAYFIQDREKAVNQDPNTDEEICIKEAYDYLYGQISDDRLKAQLKRKHGSDVVEHLNYLDILKALRDQILNCTFVSISTKDRNQANKIFEILNAKGKRLAHIDLIKNKIFEVLNKQEPADFAEESWATIKNTLNSEKESVGLATYYRHFWISKYKRTYSNKLYDDFSSIPKTEASYKEFLENLLSNVKIYMQIVNPKREDYNNRKEYFWLVQSLNSLNNYFNVVQVRIALLALFDLKQRDIIDLKLLKKTIVYLENFHFAYNAILTGRSNRLESIYSNFAIALRKSRNKEEANNVINQKLVNLLEPQFPAFNEFRDRFINLNYSKKDNSLNVKTKYAINKLNCYYSQKELFEDDGSIEHIFPESAGEQALNIGNLILLEAGINENAGKRNYQEKIEYYKKSKYSWVGKFVEQHLMWDDTMIVDRAKILAKEYYTKILGKELPEDTRYI